MKNYVFLSLQITYFENYVFLSINVHVKLRKKYSVYEMAQDLLENTLLRLKSLESKFDGLEGNVLSHGTYFAEIETDHEEDRDNVEKLKERVAHIEWDLQPGLEKRFEAQQEELISQLADADREYEEKFRVLNVQNEELRSHLNMTIDAVNNISRILNSLIEQKKFH